MDKFLQITVATMGSMRPSLKGDSVQNEVLGFSTGDQIGANLLQCFDLMIHGGKERETREKGKV